MLNSIALDEIAMNIYQISIDFKCILIIFHISKLQVMKIELSVI